MVVICEQGINIASAVAVGGGDVDGSIGGGEADGDGDVGDGGGAIEIMVTVMPVSAFMQVLYLEQSALVAAP